MPAISIHSDSIVECEACGQEFAWEELAGENPIDGDLVEEDPEQLERSLLVRGDRLIPAHEREDEDEDEVEEFDEQYMNDDNAESTY